MGFKTVSLRSFRNLKEQSIDISRKNIYLIGQNGQGKTNFLELIYYLCYAASFRTRNEKILIEHEAESFFLSAEFRHSSDDLSSTLRLYQDRNQKKIQLNGKTVRDRKDIISNFPCVVFCHNDLYFVNGSPEKKRIYLDQCVSLNDPLFINYLRNYKKILKERNFLLKEKKRELIGVYTEQLIENGFPIQQKRTELVKFINQRFNTLYNRITGIKETLSFVYNSSWKGADKEDILSEMVRKEQKEIQYGLTLAGPHRDSFSIMLGSNDYLNFASTGQLRIISLILRILQSEYYMKSTGRLPILLVDDVLLELDREKREKMMKCFPSYEQIFYTFLPGDIRETEEDSYRYRVSEGLLEVIDG